MNKQTYTSKAGLKQYRPVITEKELMHGYLGFCVACGTKAYGVEPDARKYECAECAKPKVYGIEELMLIGLAIVK